MAKKAVRPRYQPFRGGWYVVRDGRRVCLAKGAQGDRQVWAAAVRKYWEVMQVPLVERMRAVDWERLAGAQHAIEPAGPFATAFPQGEHERYGSREWMIYNWEVNCRTEAQLRAGLDRAGVTDEMMSLFVPMPGAVERGYRPSPPPPGPPPPPFQTAVGETIEDAVRRWCESWPGYEAWAAGGGDERESQVRRRVCRWVAGAFVTHGIPSDRLPLVLKRVDDLALDFMDVRDMISDLPRLRELAGMGRTTDAGPPGSQA